MENVSIITDSNPEMGSGNLIRCKILAKKLKQTSFSINKKLPVQSDIIIVDLKGVKVINLDELTKNKDYVIMNEEFLQYHNKPKKARNKIENILMFLGGYDKDAVTIKMIDILARLDIKIKKTILVSNNFMHFDELETSRRRWGFHNIEIIKEAKNIPELIYNSDLAISSGGNMMYEFACVGIPIICLPEDEAEYKLCNEFQELKIARNLGYGSYVKGKFLLTIINELSSLMDVRQDMIDNGKRYIDGKGLQRVLKYIKSK